MKGMVFAISQMSRGIIEYCGWEVTSCPRHSDGEQTKLRDTTVNRDHNAAEVCCPIVNNIPQRDKIKE